MLRVLCSCCLRLEKHSLPMNSVHLFEKKDTLKNKKTIENSEKPSTNPLQKVHLQPSKQGPKGERFCQGQKAIDTITELLKVPIRSFGKSSRAQNCWKKLEKEVQTNQLLCLFLYQWLIVFLLLILIGVHKMTNYFLIPMAHILKKSF